MSVNVTVRNEKDAWLLAAKLIGPKEEDVERSNAAGYFIYSCEDGYISDLHTRLELNFTNGEVINIFIDEMGPTAPVTVPQIEKLLDTDPQQEVTFVTYRGDVAFYRKGCFVRDYNFRSLSDCYVREVFVKDGELYVTVDETKG